MSYETDADLVELRKWLLDGAAPSLRPDQGREAFDAHRDLATLIHRAMRLDAHRNESETDAWVRYFAEHFPAGANDPGDARLLFAKWRTCLVKDSTTGAGIAITHGQPHVHRKRDAAGRLCLDLESMWAEFEHSIDQFLAYLHAHPDRRKIAVSLDDHAVRPPPGDRHLYANRVRDGRNLQVAQRQAQLVARPAPGRATRVPFGGRGSRGGSRHYARPRARCLRAAARLPLGSTHPHHRGTSISSQCPAGSVRRGYHDLVVTVEETPDGTPVVGMTANEHDAYLEAESQRGVGLSVAAFKRAYEDGELDDADPAVSDLVALLRIGQNGHPAAA